MVPECPCDRQMCLSQGEPVSLLALGVKIELHKLFPENLQGIQARRYIGTQEVHFAQSEMPTQSVTIQVYLAVFPKHK